MAGPLPDTVYKPQPQYAQIRMMFSGPLLEDEQVATVDDLLSLTRNYQHKMVWVRQHTAYYYLTDGDGSLPGHWTRYWNTSTIEMYDPNKPMYTTGEIVYLNGVIYRAKIDVPQGTPVTNGTYWQVITGEAITLRYVFENVSQTIVKTTIRNPLFTIFTGTLPKDGNDDYIIGDDGMIKIDNPEQVLADYYIDENLSDANGIAYVFEFYENEALSQQSGIINVK